MPHLLDLTLGTEYKGNDGETYKVVGNLSDGNKIYCELQKVEEPEQLINET